MKLSIIIPTYNRIEVLPRALDSIFAQNYLRDHADTEIIVVDDGSDDGTADIFKHEFEKKHNNKFENLKYVVQENKGVSAARNTGISEAKGEWFAFLDSDDEWLPNKLDRQFAEISSGDLKVCHTEEIWIRNGVRVNQMNKHQKAGGEIFERCLPMCAMSPSSILIHGSVFDHVGVFDESLPACEDYDLWLRICAHYQVAYVAEPCINKYGGHDDQLSRAFWGMDRFRVLALEKLLTETLLRESKADHKLSPDQAALTLAMMKKKNRILLNGARKHGNKELQSACEARIVKFGL